MPNKRAKNKVLLGAFVDRDLKEALIRAANERGLTATDAIVQAVNYYLNHDSDVSRSIPPKQTTLDLVNRTADKDAMQSTGESPAYPSSDFTVDEVWLL